MATTVNDKGIGANLTRLRGDMSQAALADKMRERGHRWSQATVWSVEKGDRPLRLTEAVDVAQVLAVRTDSFVMAPADLARGVELSQEAVDLTQRRVEIMEALEALREELEKAEALIELAKREGIEPEQSPDATTEDALFRLVDVFERSKWLPSELHKAFRKVDPTSYEDVDDGEH